MSSIDAVNEPNAEGGPGEQDLGPLAWVLEELRKSLDGAVKALRRFVHDADLARESDLASLDVATLRIARQQLHQASGALEMVGMASPALVLRSMESAVQKFVQRPELCTDDAAGALERASFALSEYLESVLAGKPVSPVALFPQYRDIQALTGADRVHPADLWPVERRFREPDIEVTAQPLEYGPAARARLDQAVLKIVKDADFDAARELRDLSLGFVAGQTDRQSRAFWKICAGFFEAFSRGMFAPDVYAKRVASRILMQYATLARGDAGIADRLVQDLLFFCSQAQPSDGEEVPCLRAVRTAFGLERNAPVDYEARRFGRFDPAVLVQARKRISAAAETWSALAGGDRNKLKPAADQFSLVCDSLRKLHRNSESLAQALTKALDTTTRSGEPPSPALAMEVATAVLYLQAALEETDTAEEQMVARARRLAERLDSVSAGGDPEPLELWMEELYRRVSDNQTMGSVVGELRSTLGEAERAMDQFFRNPEDVSALTAVPGRLAQMRGVLSVLGLDQASLAVLRMRDTVERLLANDVPSDDERKQIFEKLGNSLGALGFLIDMLSYQRAMARKLFVYDEDLGELRILMGRTRARASDSEENQEAVAQKIEDRSPIPLPDVVSRASLYATAGAVPAVASPTVLDSGETAGTAEPLELPEIIEAVAPVAVETSVAPETEPVSVVATLPAQMPEAEASVLPLPVPVVIPEVEEELLDIFLEEAREVVTNGLAAVQTLVSDPGDLSEQTTLRRAFHTLKGSSRMVGLNDFGEAAWSMEQLLNAWLAEQKPMHPPLLQLSEKALQAFGRWADDIAAGQGGGWQVSSFSDAADAMRLHGAVVPLVLPGEADAAPILPMQVAMDVPELPQAQSVASDEAVEAVGALMPELDDFDDGLPVPDFSETTPLLLDDEPTALPSEAMEVPLAEDIDFSEFSAALEEPPQALAPSAEVDLLLELPGAEVHVVAPVSEALEVPLLQEEPIEAAVPAVDEVSSELLPEEEPCALEEAMQAGDASASQIPEPAVAQEMVPDENVKVIDNLRISIPLYNVYLNEADEWSRRLVTSIQEWSMELHERVPDTAVALAHSLAGSSATVGFQALSDTARLLEHALEHVQLQSQGAPEDARAFLGAADDIRRLLHQFAAGFLKESNPLVLEELRRILQTEVVSTQYPPLEDADRALDVFLAEEEAAASMAEEDLVIEDAGATDQISEPELSEPVPDVVEPVKAEPERGHVAPALSVPVRLSGVPASEPVAQPSAAATDIDDEIDAIDVIDPDLFPIFEEEAAELLPVLGGALRQWAARPDNMGARTEVLRALHTLKGSARLAGAMRLGELSHRLESAIEQLDVETVQSQDIEPLQGSFDGLQTTFAALRAISDQAPTEPVAVAPVKVEAANAVDASQSVPQVVRAAVAKPQGPLELAPTRATAGHSVRVRAQLLDRLVNQAGEVMITRSRLEARLSQLKGSMGDLTGNLERLRQQLRDIEVQSESQMQSRLALSKESAAGFDPLEFDRFTRVQELTRMMAESVNDVATIQRNLQRTVEGAEDDLIAQGRQARELQRDLLRTRMVEFEGIAERLYAVVRQSSKETGKQIKLDITGGSIEMDRGVLDRMTPAFEHLLRNCVAHGIETPDQRVAQGKPASGTITVDLRHEGNDVSVEFRDDGAGLNLPGIRAKAISQGMIAPEAELSDADAANLIFLPGFSTATEVTGLAGRGIGMDVVRAEVNSLGGRIETTTKAGQGAGFRMVLPLTTAVTQVVMLRAGDLAVGVPANIVEIVRRVPTVELEAAYRNGTFEVAGEQLPFFWSGALLQASQRSSEATTGKTRPVVVLRSAAQRIAMHVDEVLGNREVVVKNLGPQLSRLPGLAGMSVLASGAVVLIYNPVALATVYGEQVRATGSSLPLGGAAVNAVPEVGSALPMVAAPASGQVPLVLVVDDSITVRRVTQRLLQREGYRVVLAADGLQALERLQEERPTVVLSDIEMPRMDGFDLARNIRADAALRGLPIIMITSRIAQKHREHAMELGVNHYLGKPYSDDELLSLIQHYAKLAAGEVVA